MKSEKARELVKSMEVDYNARNKMINSTVAHQAVQMAEQELTQKAIEAHWKCCPNLSKDNERMCKHLGDCDRNCLYMNDFIKRI